VSHKSSRQKSDPFDGGQALSDANINLTSPLSHIDDVHDPEFLATQEGNVMWSV